MVRSAVLKELDLLDASPRNENPSSQMVLTGEKPDIVEYKSFTPSPSSKVTTTRDFNESHNSSFWWKWRRGSNFVLEVERGSSSDERDAVVQGNVAAFNTEEATGKVRDYDQCQLRLKLLISIFVAVQ